MKLLALTSLPVSYPNICMSAVLGVGKGIVSVVPIIRYLLFRLLSVNTV